MGPVNQLPRSLSLRFAYPSLPLVLLGFAGCAYFDDGAATRISLRRTAGDTVLVNGFRLPDSTRQIEVRNASQDRITFKSAEGEKAESIQSRINPMAFGNLVCWPYGLVDWELGSHRRVIAGERYAVVGTGKAIQDACESRARKDLKWRIQATWLWFLAGSGFSLWAGGLSMEEPKQLEIVVPLNLVAFAGLAGAGYNVYRTGVAVGDIDACLDRRLDSGSKRGRPPAPAPQ